MNNQLPSESFSTCQAFNQQRGSNLLESPAGFTCCFSYPFLHFKVQQAPKPQEGADPPQRCGACALIREPFQTTERRGCTPFCSAPPYKQPGNKKHQERCYQGSDNQHTRSCRRLCGKKLNKNMPGGRDGDEANMLLKGSYTVKFPHLPEKREGRHREDVERGIK